MKAAALALVGVALVAGSIEDRPTRLPPLTIGGYRVLAVDFHTHSSMWSDGAFTPWGLAFEAERHGLDAVTVTGHNEVWDGQLAQRVSRALGGPIVIAGEEVWAYKRFHLIAAGVRTVVSHRQSAAAAIDDAHRQGGVAIAAHPFPKQFTGWDEAAMATLDGGEVCHPEMFARPTGQRELEEFAARRTIAAIGSSDFHGLGAMGVCRTFVFAGDASAEGILDAVRARRTVVFGEAGRAYGDPALLQYAGRLRSRVPASDARGSALDWVSRVAALVGFAALLCV